MKKFGMISWLALMFGCGSTPIEPNDMGRRAEKDKGFSLDFEEIMEFDQGQMRSYPITAAVPPPGAVVLKAEGLPEGAAIEGQNLVYTPPCSLALAEGKFYRGYVSFRILMTLKSDRDEASQLQKAGILLVFRHNDPERACGT